MHSSFLPELIGGLRLRRLWCLLAWYDIRARYRGSVLGPIWITLSLAIFVGALGFLYSTLFKVPLEKHMPYIATGMVAWTFISASLLEGSKVFVDNAQIIKGVRLPYSIYVCRTVSKNIIIFAHNFPIVLIVLAIFPVGFSWINLMVVPVILFLALNSAWITIVLGILNARYRDVDQLMVNLTQIIFFLTPIFWFPDMLTGRRAIIADANVLYHFIQIIREPLLGRLPESLTIYVILITTVIGWALAVLLLRQHRKRLAYWL